LADHDKISIGAEERTQALPDDGMIVREKNGNLL
jgi:hypothetical protein